MAVSTANGVTSLTPTAWKWFVGAALMFFLIPPFGLLISIIFILMGAGALQRLTLTKQELIVRNWFSTKSYAWSEIDDFRVYKIRSGLITAANMVSFSHANKQGTMMGKAAKLLVGGTHSIPAVGMKAKSLIQLMQAYKLGYVPEDSAVAAVPARPAQASAPAQPIPPRAIPATPRSTAQAPQEKPAFGGKPRRSTPLVQDGGGLFGRRRPNSPFQS